MEFNLPESIKILSRTPNVIEVMLAGLSDEWIFNNEGGESWNAFDIVGHYIHGEQTDWIPRMQVILSDKTDKMFVPFDRFAQFNNSKGKTLNELLDEFKRLRKENLHILQSANLTEADLEKTGIHPHFGSVTLKQLLATWVAHDLSHIHQLCRVLAKQYSEAVGPWKEYLGVLNR